jgi:polar amino acid transport system substrate-binding protein
MRGLVRTILLCAALAGCTASGSGSEETDRPGPGIFSQHPFTLTHPAEPADYAAPSGAEKCDPRQSLNPGTTGPTLDEIRARGYIVVGVDQSAVYFANLNFRTNNIEGFDIDVAEAIGAALFGEPGHVRFQVITQAQRIPALKEGRVDIVVNTMTITCDRKQEVDFSSNYYDDGQKILVPYDSPAQTLADLGGKRVCSAGVTTSIATIRDHPARPLPYAAATWTDCLMALQLGQVDAVSTTEALLRGLADQDARLEVRGPRFTDEPHGIAVRKGRPDLVRFVNATLERMRQDGRWQTLYTRWLAGALGPAQPPKAVHLG